MDKRNVPKVSVVMPFYNCPYVERAIQSVLQQSYPHIELIVVSDGSTKHTDLVKPYLSRIVYVEKPNGGTATALNAGIRRATGELFAWLSSDDVYDLTKVEKQVNFMLRKNAAVSYTNFHLIDGNDHITRMNVGLHFEDRLYFLKHLVNSCPVNGSTIMMRMDVFQKVGLFDEALPFTHDFDYWKRAAHFYTFHSLPESLTLYRVHDAMGSVVHSKEQWMEIQSVNEKYKGSLERLINEVR
ncbi:glycosyltransferase [Bacillus sp. 3255]|uniref:glycosyltransferase n=1 Tax=Bacillus sp. 3255 TaxID=2817904 RepID=UPI002860A272|nr:glycosyltransferase [Bacillus sp. 3255]MDR6883157.1 glycosyltransferase involved in cell wall biosynthesis [Bacillus sp. 3255]